jgi:hypothetical protein
MTTGSFARIALMCATAFLGATALVRAGPIEPRTISAEQFRAMAVAVAELEDRGLDVARYEITFWDEEESIVVLFEDRNLPPEIKESLRGSPPKPWAASFGVEVSRDDFRVLKANTQR